MKHLFNVHVVFITTPDMECTNISMAQARKNLLNKKPLNVIILFQVTLESHLSIW